MEFLEDSPLSETEAPGEHLVRDLLWIHGILRNDLALAQQLAQDVLGDESTESILARIGSLETRSPLWQLKQTCLYYCRIVHMHHTGEDFHIFPAVRRFSDEMNAVVDKLEADHRRVADFLKEVEAAARRLEEAETMSNRQAVAASLTNLAEHLLTHLRYEEEAISPVLRTWNSWDQG